MCRTNITMFTDMPPRRKIPSRKGIFPFLIPAALAIGKSLAAGAAATALTKGVKALTRKSKLKPKKTARKGKKRTTKIVKRRSNYSRKKNFSRLRGFNRRGDLDTSFLDTFGGLSDDVITAPTQRSRIDRISALKKAGGWVSKLGSKLFNRISKKDKKKIANTITSTISKKLTPNEVKTIATVIPTVKSGGNYSNGVYIPPAIQV